MPQMKDNGKSSYALELFSKVLYADTDIIVLYGTVYKVLIATVDGEKEVFREAEITAPEAVGSDPVAMHQAPQEFVLYLEGFSNPA